MKLKARRFTDERVIGERQALARNVRHIRGDLTQPQFARAVGMCTSTVKAIEDVSRYPMLKTVLKISNAAGAELKELFEHMRRKG